MTAVLLALGASAAWGASDFLGGLRAKNVTPATVLLVSQGAGLVIAAAVLLVRGRQLPADPALALGLLGGVAAVVDLGFIYVVLARGPVIVIAPIAALGASIPAVAGIAGGDPLSATIAAGIACALVGSLGASYESGGEPGPAAAARSTIALALGAGVGIGAALILLERASQVDPVWAAGALRVGGFLSAAALFAVVALRDATAEADPRALGAGTLASLAVVGAFDVLADLGYAVATTSGSLSTVAVLASLYPVVTVALGFLVLRERVLPVQFAGVVLAMTGVALLAVAPG